MISLPEGLGSMPDAIKCPPSTHGVRTREISRSKSLMGGHRKNHGCCGWRIFPSPPVPCLNCGEGERWCRHPSRRSPTCLRLWQHSFLSVGMDTPTTTISVMFG
ncbi:hypothetical protein TNCV_1736281 [Trichonephila clavipes]|nr:hypothetical protein TNCV_1736281 [Trichonephila clavipes]